MDNGGVRVINLYSVCLSTTVGFCSQIINLGEWDNKRKLIKLDGRDYVHKAVQSIGASLDTKFQ